MRYVFSLVVSGFILVGCQVDQSPKAEVSNKMIVQPDEKLKSYEGKPAKNLRPPLVDYGVYDMDKDKSYSNSISKEVHIYYSSVVKTEEYTAGGGIHARMLANLIGHYRNINVKISPIKEYTSEEAKKAEHIFYIGTVYDEKLPQEFIDEVKSGRSVVWINYNIWNLGQEGLNSLGLNFDELHVANSPELYNKTFNKIQYKGSVYKKHLAYMEMNQVTPNSGKVKILANAINGKGESIPYALRSGDFWYIADNPFIYIHPTDRYLVMADLVHSILGSKKSCEAKAMLRIEDLGARDHPLGFQSLLNTIEQVKIPFAMTIIPKHYSNGVEYSWKQNGEMLNLLYRALDMGGIPIQHGYLHAYEGLKNPNGISGSDWEFWNHKENTPISGLTPEAAERRIKKGRDILLDLGIYPLIWTTPHYEADTKLYSAINNKYPNALEGRVYKEDGYRSGQFFPYAVRDSYNSLVYPENLGYIRSGYGISQILEAARLNRNLHCPTASLFVHPYLFNPEYTGKDAVKPEDFKRMIQEIQDMGYRFVSPFNMNLSVSP